ncbi:hypothetical protein OGM63_01655 [Plectonema radiosum NIES-515]|uniref:Uncharacterized protein n=1 Tax=Plectonema radiosum NIES-515 TaxID=2986073 RepID=A0ABT3AUJ3_9CYAN|nr:hypothetical protein [Plectonema radiosum]MCV3212244.1 hypothetical protein [Plectonema radiosum NIES-515]
MLVAEYRLILLSVIDAPTALIRGIIYLSSQLVLLKEHKRSLLMK